MADEKTTIKETTAENKPKKENKFVTFFKNLPRKIAAPFKNMWHELKKVTWPTRKELINYTCIVLVFMAFMGLVIGLLDMGATKLVTAMSSLKAGDTATADTADGVVGVTDPDENATVEATDTPAADETAEPTDAPADGN